jgi:large subunit ribosomal protein L3
MKLENSYKKSLVQTKFVANSARPGVVAEKIGMTSHFTDDGKVIPATVLKVFECVILEIKSVESHGYNSVVIGYGKARKRKITKPMLGVFKKNNINPVAKVKEFRIGSDYVMVDKFIDHNYFRETQFIDVSGISIGKGFAGGMKRWNFRGLEASHGVSISHRSHGSTGQRQDPGKVFKGKKMAGHMGCRKVNVQNLEVLKIDSENGLLIIKGCVPGFKGGKVFVTDAKKKTEVL